MKGFTMKTKKKKIGFTPTPIYIVGEKEECVQNQSGRQIAKSTASRKLVWGFTIVELLTVMAVIAMLMGILVPALNLVRKLAKNTNQKAQFHGIEVGLETYISDGGNGDQRAYPESSPSGAGAAGAMTVGAQKLAEALIGRDMLGLDPNTSWDAKFDETLKDRYASTKTPKNSSAAQVTASLDRREGPYLNIEKTDAFQVGQIFTDIGTGYVYSGLTSPAPVLTDTFRAKRIILGGKTVMAGTPILYYKADTNSKKFPDTNSVTSITPADANNAIYNSRDNEELIYLGTIKTYTVRHLFDQVGTPALIPNGRWKFYDTITNKQIVSQPRPFNSTSYILMSAGADGIYGTKDDIYNFN
jgi:type II secretory pathway pseudopilin PulG